MIAGFLLDGASDRLIREKGDYIPAIRDFYLSSPSHSKIESETPPLSPVCWASFLTGKDPSEHNIFGFIERDFENNRFYIPGYNDIKCRTIFDILDDKRSSFAAVNIPGTYPPPYYNRGIIISDFLSPSLDRAVNHKWMLPILNGMGYKIDINPYGHAGDRAGVLDEIKQILQGRRRLLRWINDNGFDAVLFHVMELDRLCHYFLKDIYNENSSYFLSVLSILSDIDSLFRDFLMYFKKAGNTVFLLSDHGFEPVKREFFPNTLLYNSGMLKLDNSILKPDSNDLPIISPSGCFSLYPGRVYSINPDTLKRYSKNTKSLIQTLGEITKGIEFENKPVIEKIISTKEIYSDAENINYDIYMKAQKGIDIKGFFIKDTILRESRFQGMHDPIDGIFASNKALDTGKTIRISSVKDMMFC